MVRAPRFVLAVVVTLGVALGLSACGPNKKQQESLAAAEAFLAQNAKQPGVVTLPDGLQYKIVRSGPATGAKPGPIDEVKVHYEGKLTNGEIFDSSYERGQPASFPLQGLVPAWKEALVMMRPGDEWTLYVPPALGYGAHDNGQIPGNSVMIFRIELIDVLATKIQAPKERAPA
ncbi:peptidylprolyl isomerase [Caulobacter sp. Root655]|uniref:FKBP-type peptidyl-prolyl cis-trans isomerase n=1 Tax=Caulobacter sp. Root655 TaxID=1736578 RepID=UPI0006F2F9A0|nr:FKBP-type peptidyl-prolyl cis-trans isomerase [Caulobacter sp. Root655]KRA65870.1 peptidylprolyl isomerase [Caulobacter sp. Root655]